MKAELSHTQSSKLAAGLEQGLACGRFLVKLARTEAEIDEVLRLRYRVFNEELGEGIPENSLTQRDEDAFDKYCDHLLLLVEGKIVATYRLLHGPKRPPEGFYSETEFSLKNLPINFEQAVELGRACIDPDHRKQTTLMTLFWGLHCYMEYKQARYLMGCGSLFVKSNEDAMATYDELKKAGRVTEVSGVGPLPKNAFEASAQGGNGEFPPLLKLYVEFGAMIYSKPAYDPVFRCYDLFMIFDMEHLSSWGLELLVRFDKKYLGDRPISE